MGAKWVLGVSVNLVGSVLINLGTNVMKLGHNRRAALPLPEEERPPISRFREWRLGVAAFSIGNAANFLSFGYAAQSLLSAIGCVQFVSNVVFASVVLKEQVTRGVLAATACIVVGCVLLVSFGDHSSRVYTAHDLLGLYAQPAYAAYLSLSGAAVVGSWLLFHLGMRRTANGGSRLAARAWGVALPLLYSTFSALVGTQSVLFSKTLAVLLRATFGGDNQFKSWFIYVMLPCFLFAAVFWITRLNKGLKLFPAMVIVPTLQIAWTLFSIISGMLYFQEFRDFTKLGAAMFAVGLVIMFAGVYLLTRCAGAAPDGSSRGLTEERVPMMAAAGDAGVALCDSLASGKGAASAQLPGAEGWLVSAQPMSEAEREEAGLLAAGALDSAGSAGAPVATGGDRRRRMLRRVVSSLRRRAAVDFDLDESTAARLALGLGDGEMPALSVFGPPAVDFGAPPPRSMRHRSRHVEVMPAGGAAGSGTGGEAGDLEESSFVGWQAATAGPVIGGGGGDTSGGSAAAESAPGIGLGGSGKAVQPDGRAGAPAGARRSREQLLRLSGEGPGGNDSELPLPAHHLLRRPLATGGFNPLANAISIERPASPKPQPASPFAGFVHGVEAATRGMRTAVSTELRASAEALLRPRLSNDRGYARAGALSGGGRGGEDGDDEAGGERLGPPHA